jgi:hypothetical protein
VKIKVLIRSTPHTIHIYKVRAHSSIIGNTITDTLANHGTLKEKPSTTSHIHIAHSTPYCLASCLTTTHDKTIPNLHTFIIKEHRNREAETTKNKSPYLDKWLSNNQIKPKTLQPLLEK